VEFYEKEEVEYLSDFAYKKYEVCYGNIFSCKEAEVTIKGNVDTSKLGEYEIKYTYSYNGKSLEKTHMVKVVDKDAPMITIKDENFCYCENNRIPPYEVKAIDNYDGDISDKVKSFLKEGKIVFEVEDSSGNKTTLEKNAEKKDNNAPEITLNGNATIFLKLNEEYEEYGAKATDFCDGDLTEKIEIEGTTLIPVCKISAGYVTGGGEYGENKNVTPLLSGGIGGGYGVKPLAFLCVSGGKVKVLGVDKPSGFEALIDVVATAVNCFTKNCCDKKGGKKK